TRSTIGCEVVAQCRCEAGRIDRRLRARQFVETSRNFYPGFDARSRRGGCEGSTAEIREPAEHTVESVVGGIADLGSLVRSFEQARPHSCGAHRLDHFNGGSPGRLAKLRSQEAASDDVAVADLVLH